MRVSRRSTGAAFHPQSARRSRQESAYKLLVVKPPTTAGDMIPSRTYFALGAFATTGDVLTVRTCLTIGSSAAACDRLP